MRRNTGKLETSMSRIPENGMVAIHANGFTVALHVPEEKRSGPEWESVQEQEGFLRALEAIIMRIHADNLEDFKRLAQLTASAQAAWQLSKNGGEP